MASAALRTSAKYNRRPPADGVLIGSGTPFYSPSNPKYDRVILEGMKTAVSIPDVVFAAAERLAQRRGCSRSSLYTIALESLLASADRTEVTARLNEVYQEQSSELDPVLRAAQQKALADERW